MADVIRIELSGEEYEEIKKALVKRLAGMNEASEEYRKLDVITGKFYRAQWFPQAESQKTEGGGQTTASREADNVGQTPIKPPQAQSAFKPTLPPRQTYQPQTMENAQPRHVISEKQAKRLYAIQMKSGKKQFEVKEYLKRLGFNNSKEVTSDKYDAIINWIQG